MEFQDIIQLDRIRFRRRHHHAQPSGEAQCHQLTRWWTNCSPLSTRSSNRPAQVVILTGAGKAFCAGMDLDESEGPAGQNARGERRGLLAHGAHFSPHLRLSPADHRRRERRGHRRRHGICHHVRLHSGRARSQVRLHRSPHRIRAGHRFLHAGLAGGTQDRPRSAADRAVV